MDKMSIHFEFKTNKNVIGIISIHYNFDEQKRFYVYIYIVYMLNNKKILKTPKGQSESVSRRRTDNTRTKGKQDKQQTTKHYKEH